MIGLVQQSSDHLIASFTLFRASDFSEEFGGLTSDRVDQFQHLFLHMFRHTLIISEFLQSRLDHYRDWHHALQEQPSDDREPSQLSIEAHL